MNGKWNKLFWIFTSWFFSFSRKFQLFLHVTIMWTRWVSKISHFIRSTIGFTLDFMSGTCKKGCSAWAVSWSWLRYVIGYGMDIYGTCTGCLEGTEMACLSDAMKIRYHSFGLAKRNSTNLADATHSSKSEVFPVIILASVDEENRREFNKNSSDLRERTVWT